MRTTFFFFLCFLPLFFSCFFLFVWVQRSEQGWLMRFSLVVLCACDCFVDDESWAKSLDHKSALLIDPNGVNIEEYGGKNVEKWVLCCCSLLLFLLIFASPASTSLTSTSLAPARSLASTSLAPREMLDAAKQYVEEEEKEKHRCKVVVNEAECGKLFKASVFVEKHVLNKHRAFLENAAKKRIDDVSESERDEGDCDRGVACLVVY